MLLSLLAEDVKKKWTTIRDQYTRVIREQIKTSGAPASNKKDPWAFAAILTFLQPHINVDL